MKIKSLGKLLVLLVILLLTGAGSGIVYAAESSDFDYYEREDEDGTVVTIYEYYGKEENLVIPEEINGHKVTGIFMEALEGEPSNMVTHSVTIPAGVTDFFVTDLGALTDISVDERNENFKSVEGIVYSKDGSSLISVPVGRTGILKVPEGTSCISYDAFDDCKGITGLELPASIMVMEIPWVLQGIENLEQISVSEANEIYSVEDHLLYDKKKETLLFCPSKRAGEVILPDTVKNIGEYAFEGCGELEKAGLPEGMEKISYGAFSGCKKISELSLPSTLKEIKSYAFSGCSAMKSIRIPAEVETIGQGIIDYSGITDVVVDENNKFYSYENGALYNKDGTVIYQCMLAENGELKMKEGVKEISAGAFAYTHMFHSVIIPESVTKIGESAFENCSLASITIPGNVAEVGQNAFYGCEDLESVVISEGVTQVGSNMFRGCYYLKKVTLPSTLTRIGASAFAFTGLEAVELPESLTDIETFSFYSTGLSEVHIPKNVKEIGSEAFAGSQLKKVYLDSETISLIGEAAFNSRGDEAEVYVKNQTVYDLVKNSGGNIKVILEEKADPLELSKSKVTLYTGNSMHSVTVKAVKNDITGKVKWTTSNPAAAVVKNGKITAVKKGKATITATVGTYKKKVSVTVKDPVITVIDGSKQINTIKVKKGKTIYYPVKTNPSNSKVKLVADKNSKKFAKMTLKNNTISIKGIKKGNVTLKLQSGGGTKKVTLKVQ